MSTILHEHPPRPTNIPGPRGLPLVGALPAMLRAGMFEYIEACWRRHGDIFQVPIGGSKRIYVVSHPDAAERILQTAVDNYYKGRTYDPIRPLLGNGLVTSTGSFWARQRKLSQPAFHLQQIRRFVTVMTRCTHDMLANWETHARAGTAFDLYAETMKLTQRIVGLTLFGLDLSGKASDSAKAVTECLNIAGERVNRGALVVPLAVPTPTNIRFKRALRILDDIVYGIIARARQPAAEGEEVTLLRLLVDARDEETGEAMSDQQLRDEIITHYVAGHETTALVLAWAFYYLDRNPGHDARICAEIGGFANDEAPTLEDLEGLTYTRMFLSEVMRLRPPVWAQTRVTHEEDTLLGHTIPADSQLILSGYFCQRHPDFWDEPEIFRPDRFTPEAAKARHRYAYFPFSTGPRACIGKRFALYEMTLVFALVLARYRVDLVDARSVGMKVAATCHPDRPLMARVAPRATSS